MVRVQRANLLDPSAPNPSVETLLHAFLPHAFVDHTHSTAVLSLTDQPEGEKLCEEVYGKRLGYVPYIMPGFALAKAAADAFERDRSVEGLILHKHGIFTFGADAREAYERMIEHVTLAEERLKRGRKTLAMAKLPAQIAAPRRGRADHPRRLRAEGRQDRGRVDAHDPRLPCERCDPEFRQRRGACTLFAGRRGDARPHHPHQELAADRARAGSRQARRFFARRARGCYELRRKISDLLRHEQRPRRRHQEAARSSAPRGAGARARALRARPHQEGRARRRRSRRSRNRDDRRRRSDRPLRGRCPTRPVRHGILVAGAGQAQRREAAAARRPDRRGDGGRQRDRRRDREGVRRCWAPRSRCST